MRRRSVFKLMLLPVLLLTVILLPAATASAHGKHGKAGAAMYEVKIKNLTANQILSPPVFISHDWSYQLFRKHRYASDDLRMIAESGDNGPAAMTAKYSRRVFDVQTAGPILPGESVTVTLRTPHKARLSLATMLVQTNDGFAGVNGVRFYGLKTRTLNLMALDAGTEANNEMTEYVPGPPFGGMKRDATHERIRYHRGIRGGADIDPAVYGWRGPVAQLTITPVMP